MYAEGKTGGKAVDSKINDAKNGWNERDHSSIMDGYSTILIDCRKYCAAFEAWSSREGRDTNRKQQREFRDNLNKLQERASRFWHMHQGKFLKEPNYRIIKLRNHIAQ